MSKNKEVTELFVRLANQKEVAKTPSHPTASLLQGNEIRLEITQKKSANGRPLQWAYRPNNTGFSRRPIRSRNAFIGPFERKPSLSEHCFSAFSARKFYPAWASHLNLSTNHPVKITPSQRIYFKAFTFFVRCQTVSKQKSCIRNKENRHPAAFWHFFLSTPKQKRKHFDSFYISTWLDSVLILQKRKHFDSL